MIVDAIFKNEISIQNSNHFHETAPFVVLFAIDFDELKQIARSRQPTIAKDQKDRAGFVSGVQKLNFPTFLTRWRIADGHVATGGGKGALNPMLAQNAHRLV